MKRKCLKYQKIIKWQIHITNLLKFYKIVDKYASLFHVCVTPVPSTLAL